MLDGQSDIYRLYRSEFEQNSHLSRLIIDFLEYHNDNDESAGQPRYREYLRRLHKLRNFLKEKK